MKAHKSPIDDLEYVQSLIERDIMELAFDESYFEKMRLEPRDNIDQMIAVAKMFRLDFWEVIKRNCSDSELKRLHGLYNGIHISKLIAGNLNETEKTI